MQSPISGITAKYPHTSPHITDSQIPTSVNSASTGTLHRSYGWELAESVARRNSVPRVLFLESLVGLLCATIWIVVCFDCDEGGSDGEKHANEICVRKLSE